MKVVCKRVYITCRCKHDYLTYLFKGQGMVTSEYIDVDDNGKMINCSPLSYKIPNVRCVPRKFNVTLVREDSVETPVYSAKV